jgi:hypothetical protein
VTRLRQYLFLAAATLAVLWIVAGVYATLAAEDHPGSRSILLPILGFPYTVGMAFGAPMRAALGIVGSILALIVLWIVVTLALWVVLELLARAGGGRFSR